MHEHCLKNICSNCDRSIDGVTTTQASTKTLCEPDTGRSDISAITINCVSSYCLPVCISGTEISCLVDTVVGVSVLSGDVLDKIDLRSFNIEPLIHQKFVGLDGIPLIDKVHGARTFPLTIAGLQF